ncbi:hypothetical protein [Piscinibacter koreensis]|uniref:Phage protein n=1 Tax=Piscinibacter koreensis TaxID=2742824 RepID=A0A7Y6NR26_9BURK|nr:hypothetical protein [Schlegelella koreensis]NUZ07657.1 hypothetical protein [Schlegelella koreensis]
MGIETAALIAGGLISAGAAVYSGQQQEKMADRAADQAEADAEAARGAAMVEAAKIRKAAKEQRSAAVAALAASGVDVSAGTAEQIQTDIDTRGEEDALTVILSGGNRGRYLEADARLSRMRGGQAATAGYINGGSSLLTSVSAAAKGWKSTGKPVWGGTAADPWYG